ncbi:MAG: hypothetical protein KDB07_09290, partial [Planctomycetes bacterium]|nr:hypothetical protein [Planctomycetota bacterium]
MRAKALAVFFLASVLALLILAVGDQSLPTKSVSKPTQEGSNGNAQSRGPSDAQKSAFPNQDRNSAPKEKVEAGKVLDTKPSEELGLPLEVNLVPRIGGVEFPDAATLIDYGSVVGSTMFRASGSTFRSDHPLPVSTKEVELSLYSRIYNDFDLGKLWRGTVRVTRDEERQVLVGEGFSFDLEDAIPGDYAFIRGQALWRGGVAITELHGRLSAPKDASTSFDQVIYAKVHENGTFWIALDRQARKNYSMRRLEDQDIEALVLNFDSGGDQLTFKSRRASAFDFGSGILSGTRLEFSLTLKAHAPFAWGSEDGSIDLGSKSRTAVTFEVISSESLAIVSGEHTGGGVFVAQKLVPTSTCIVRCHWQFFDKPGPLGSGCEGTLDSPLIRLSDGEVRKVSFESEINAASLVHVDFQGGEVFYALLDDDECREARNRVKDAYGFVHFAIDHNPTVWVQKNTFAFAHSEAAGKEWLVVVGSEYQPEFVKLAASQEDYQVALKKRWPSTPEAVNLPWVLRINAHDAIGERPARLHVVVMPSDVPLKAQSFTVSIAGGESQELHLSSDTPGEAHSISVYDAYGEAGYDFESLCGNYSAVIDRPDQVVELDLQGLPTFAPALDPEVELRAFVGTTPLEVKHEIPLEGKRAKLSSIMEYFPPNARRSYHSEIVRKGAQSYHVNFAANVEVQISEEVLKHYKDIRLETHTTYVEVNAQGNHRVVNLKTPNTGDVFVWASAVVKGQRIEVWGYDRVTTFGVRAVVRFKWEKVGALVEVTGKTSGYAWSLGVRSNGWCRQQGRDSRPGQR